ncbi:MAG: hypothetical protein M1268_00725 [Patescibacteria group bacterium]|nr:hypothetical protein [Patescibacteria group bacterium]
MTKNSFQNLLHKLSLQSGEDKLKISFNLSLFAKKLKAEGERYTNNKTLKRAKSI